MLLTSAHRNWVFAATMSFTMAGIVSGVVTAINTGINEGFFLRWGEAFVIAWPVAFSVLLLMKAHIQKLATWLTSKS